MDENQTTKPMNEQSGPELLATIELQLIAAEGCPGVGQPLRDAMPALRAWMASVEQQLAELRKPCPCEGTGQADPQHADA